MHERSDSHEDAKVDEQPSGQDSVVCFLGSVPADCLVTDAHRYCSQCRPGFGGVAVRRVSSPAIKTTYNTITSATQIRKEARRSGGCMPDRKSTRLNPS